jgi:hypothetical protein
MSVVARLVGLFAATLCAVSAVVTWQAYPHGPVTSVLWGATAAVLLVPASESRRRRRPPPLGSTPGERLIALARRKESPA